jgi:hypothetical protein
VATGEPIRLNEATRAAVASGRLVHLATIIADGSSARVEEGGAVPVLRRITKGQFPPPGGDCPDGFVTRISPRHVSGTGPWGVVG